MERLSLPLKLQALFPSCPFLGCPSATAVHLVYMPAVICPCCHWRQLHQVKGVYSDLRCMTVCETTECRMCPITTQQSSSIRELWACPSECAVVYQPFFLLLHFISLGRPRSLAYSILADLVHHVRTQLTLNHLSLAVDLFSRNIHDDCLPTSIQIMSCKVRRDWGLVILGEDAYI